MESLAALIPQIKAQITSLKPLLPEQLSFVIPYLEGSEPIPYMELIMYFSVFTYLWSTYLNARQYFQISKPKPPKEVEKIYAKDKTLYSTTRAYSLDKFWYGIAHDLYSTVMTIASFHFRVLPLIWARAGDICDQLNVGSRGYSARTEELIQTIIFFVGYFVMTTATELPWNLYYQFVLEQRHGFNKMTLGLFVTDTLKTLALTCVLLGPPIVALVTYLLQTASPYIGLYLWAFFVVLTLFMMTIYPIFIAPLFNKFTPLEEGDMRTAIEKLASSLKFPLTKLFVVDGSKRSAHSNAYMYGLWKNKRIVLYDTLLSHCTVKQVVAVLAHELGHWKCAHVPKAFAIQELVLLVEFSFFTVIRADPQVMRSFGFEKAQPAFISLILFSLIMGPLSEVLGFCFNALSRKNEREADKFAVDLGHAAELKDALISLNTENKSSPHVDWLYSAYHHTHPPLVERLRFIDGLENSKKRK